MLLTKLWHEVRWDKPLILTLVSFVFFFKFNPFHVFDCAKITEFSPLTNICIGLGISFFFCLIAWWFIFYVWGAFRRAIRERKIFIYQHQELYALKREKRKRLFLKALGALLMPIFVLVELWRRRKGRGETPKPN
jgi:hypothetical protein